MKHKNGFGDCQCQTYGNLSSITFTQNGLRSQMSNVVREKCVHLTGAPRDWAGFKRTVIVVSVSLSGESVSYSGIDGAVNIQNTHTTV